MILVYIDESGDTGHNLSDKQQPVFVLGALIVPQSKWKSLEQEFKDIVAESFGDEVQDSFELHAIDLVNRRECFKSFSLDQARLFRNRCLELIINLDLKMVYRSIQKIRFLKFCEKTYGKLIRISPYIMALPFVCTRINEIIKAENDLGILIFDEYHNLVEIEKAFRTLRLDTTSTLQTDNLIERGFFVDSSKSEAIQLADLALYYIRKFEEVKIGVKVSPIHQETFPYIEKICESVNDINRGWDIINWVESQVINKEKKRLPPKDGAVS
jgi:hypothetical protein